MRLFLGDGLDHGAEAAIAVNTAIQVFKARREDSAVEMIKELHRAVRKIGGLVGTVALYIKEEKRWRICGVGILLHASSTELKGKATWPTTELLGTIFPVV